jgi:hypothetical protein
VAQVVECLPHKHEALNSNPSTAKRKKQKQKAEKKVIYSPTTMYGTVSYLCQGLVLSFLIFSNLAILGRKLT